MPKREEEKLVAQYLKGDEKALEILIKQYLKPIYSFVYSYVGNASDTEDITQEVFVKMWRNIKKFDQQKSFKTWFFTIAKNASIDFLKKKKPIPFSKFENEKGQNVFLDNLAAPILLPSEIFNRADIDSALKKLSPKYRLVLSLYYGAQLNFREIADSLDEPLNTIKSRYRRALILLKKFLV